MPMDASIPWIGLHDPSTLPGGNTAFVARRSFPLSEVPQRAPLRIVADTLYRLFINGEWVADGPAREWPGRARHDELEVSHLLRKGRNTVAVVVRFFQDSSFHRIPQHPGLRLSLETVHSDGSTRRLKTGRPWQVRPCVALRNDTARISIQQTDSEWFDAREEPMDGPAGGTGWRPAAVWRAPRAASLPRDVPMPTRLPRFPRHCVHAVAVAPCAAPFVFSTKQFCYPGNHDANLLPMAGAFATVCVSDSDREAEVFGAPAQVNGTPSRDGRVSLRRGDNLVVLGFATAGHAYELAFGFRDVDGLAFRNPISGTATPPDPSNPRPWVAIGPFGSLPSDRIGPPNAPGRIPPPGEDASAALEALRQCRDTAALRNVAGDRLRQLPDGILRRDVAGTFAQRRPLAPCAIPTAQRAALFAQPQGWTPLEPPETGDLELLLDFGDQTVGNLAFDLDAPEGAVLDATMVEHIDPQGRIQHTGGARNGFRYVARQGLQEFVSFQPRSGRYLFLTLRQARGPVRLRNLRMLEATYPVEHIGSFACPDAALNRIWDLSVRTLHLCMLDTYVDCPLYEQTLWVGDARNEALYAHAVFGSHDLTLRCLRLAGESLERLPLVGAQVPSGWDTVLPAWSFLWCIGVWDYFEYSADRAGLEALYPALVENLRRAEGFCRDGLFSMPAWNLFDWSGADQAPATVIHNTQFLVGAIRAARRCADVVGQHGDVEWLEGFAARLRAALQPLWDAVRGSYPDAIRDDGTTSPSTCQHTSALGLLYDTLPEGTRATALRNLLNPPEDMVRFGSPFATQYLFEALEAAGAPAVESLNLIRRYWQDMLDAGATTVWETFRNPRSAFPTRSHCHAWSAAPIHVFTRQVLGIRFASPGGSEMIVSPRPGGLAWARGTVATVHGPFSVAWTALADGALDLRVEAPPGVVWRFEPNPEAPCIR